MRSVGQGTGPRPDWVARKFNHRSALFRVQNYVTIPEKSGSIYMGQRDWCFGSLTGYCGRAHRAGETCPRDSLTQKSEAKLPKLFFEVGSINSLC